MSATKANAGNLLFGSAGQFELENDNKQDRLRKSAGVRGLRDEDHFIANGWWSKS